MKQLLRLACVLLAGLSFASAQQVIVTATLPALASGSYAAQQASGGGLVSGSINASGNFRALVQASQPYLFTFYPAAAKGYPVFAVSVNVQASGTQDITSQLTIALPAGSSASLQNNVNLLARYALTDGGGAPQDSSGNGNNATLPGGAANPVWTTQGITCNGSSQYFNSTGTRSARTIFWVTSQTNALNGAGPIGPQLVTPFGVGDRSFFFGGNSFYGNKPVIAISGSQNGGYSYGSLQGTHVFALVLGINLTTDQTYFYEDGQPVASTSAMGGAAGTASGALQVCGTNTGAATYFPGSMYYFEAYSDEKSAVQVAQESLALRQIVQGRGVIFLPAQNSTNVDQYLSIGDSLTNGHGVTPSSSFLTPTDTFQVTNYGVGGARSTDVDYFFGARDRQLYAPYAGRNVLRLWVGTNDLGNGATPQQALEGIRSYCREAKAVGFQTIVEDAISRTGLDAKVEGLASLMTTQTTGCDLFLDLAANPLLGAANAYSSATYFQGDGIHLTQTSQQNIVAPAETRAINLLASLQTPVNSATVTAATYTMVDGDLYLPVDPTTQSVAVTLPDCTYFTNISHSVKNLQATGANTVTVVPAAGQVVDGSSSAITVANAATLVVRAVVLNRATAGCSRLKVSNN